MDPFIRERIFAEIDALNKKHEETVVVLTKLSTIVGLQSKLIMAVVSFLALWAMKGIFGEHFREDFHHKQPQAISEPVVHPVTR